MLKGGITVNGIKTLFEDVKYRKGIYFALATALISGFAIYINCFAVMGMKDPFVFTTVKNLAVAQMFLALVILPRALPEMKVFPVGSG